MNYLSVGGSFLARRIRSYVIEPVHVKEVEFPSLAETTEWFRKDTGESLTSYSVYCNYIAGECQS